MKTKRIEVKEGNISVPIYEFSDGRFCLDTQLGKTRKRITRSSLKAAKIEARRLIRELLATADGSVGTDMIARFRRGECRTGTTANF